MSDSAFPQQMPQQFLSIRNKSQSHGNQQNCQIWYHNPDDFLAIIAHKIPPLQSLLPLAERIQKPESTENHKQPDTYFAAAVKIHSIICRACAKMCCQYEEAAYSTQARKPCYVLLHICSPISLTLVSMVSFLVSMVSLLLPKSILRPPKLIRLPS